MAKTSAAKTTKKEIAKPAAPKAKATPKAKAAPVKAAEPVKPVVAAPAAAPKAAAKPSSKLISAQERYHMIDEAAYYRAEKSGFQVDPHANWVAAEKEIDELLAKQNIKVG